MRRILAALALAAATCLALLAQGCGQTGPLYMPDSPPPAEAENESGEDTGPEPVN